jgi:hypothetical protein
MPSRIGQFSDFFDNICFASKQMPGVEAAESLNSELLQRRSDQESGGSFAWHLRQDFVSQRIATSVRER